MMTADLRALASDSRTHAVCDAQGRFIAASSTQMSVVQLNDEDCGEEILAAFDNAFGELLATDPAAFRVNFRKTAASAFACYRGTALHRRAAFPTPIASRTSLELRWHRRRREPHQENQEAALRPCRVRIAPASWSLLP